MGSRNRSGEQTQGYRRLEDDDEPVRLPPVDNEKLQNRFKQTLIGRIFSKESRSIEAVLSVMHKPHIWDVEGRVRGFDLGNDRFQFDFDSEDDLKRVLNKRPCHVNHWTFGLERWEPNIRGDFPSHITFWIQTKGLPPEHWNEEALMSIGRTLGEVEKVDEKTAKIQVAVDVTKPLKFEKKALKSDGEEVIVKLKYEKLHRYCFTCKMISHEERSCPELSEEERFRKKAERAALAREVEEEKEQSRQAAIVPKSTSRAGSNLDYRRETSSRYDHESHSPSRRHRSPLNRYIENHDRNIVWNRLSDTRGQPWGNTHSSPLPRHREYLNYPSRDQRKRRLEETATSSWRPKMSSQRDEEHRGWKYQRTNMAERRDMRYHLDQRRDTRYVPRENTRHVNGTGNSMKIYVPKQSKEGDVEGDVSKTIIDSERRQHRPIGLSHYYKEKSLNSEHRHGTRSKVTSPLLNREKNDARPSPDPDTRKNMSGGLVHYTEKSPFIEYHERSKAQSSIEKEAAALSAKKIMISAPIDTSTPENQKKKGIKDFLLSEEEEAQLLKDVAVNNVMVTEEEEKELLRKADELMMEQEDVDNDDLLEEDNQISLEQTVSDRIKPLSRRAKLAAGFSPSPNSKRGLASPSRRPAKERIEFPSIPIPKSAHRKRKTDSKKRSRELMGVSSKKRNAAQLTGSPLKRAGTTSAAERSRTRSSNLTVPQNGAFPSAVGRKTKPSSGSVGPQKPPSKNI